MSKQSLCRICKKRPPWNYKNCPPNVCKQCYHRHIWESRPAARKERQASAAANAAHERMIGEVAAFDDELEFVDDRTDDEASVESQTNLEFQ